MRQRLISVVIGCIGVLTTTSASAAIVVNSNADLPASALAGDCNSGDVCTLRAAMMKAHATSGPHTIELDHPGPYFLSIPEGAGFDLPSSGDLDVIHDVTVLSSGGTRNIVAGHNDRFFEVMPGGALTLFDVALFGGGGGSLKQGGAILVVDGSLHMEDAYLIDNEARWHGGAVHGDGSSLISAVRTKFLNNRQTQLTSLTGGGAISLSSALVSGTGDLVAVDCTFKDNSAYEGGAVWSRLSTGNVDISGSLFERNDASWVGGAVSVWSPPTPTEVTNSTFTDNIAFQGGALNLRGDANIALSTFTANIATSGGGAISHAHEAPTHLQIDECTFDRNDSGSSGGALSLGTVLGAIGSTQVTESVFKENHAVRGGAVDVASTEAEMTLCTFQQNSATSVGGAIRASGPGWLNGAGEPFGLWTFEGSTTKIVDSWIDNNDAAGVIFAGGGIHVDGAELVLLRTTLSNNTSTGDAGALRVSDGKLRITNATISGNQSSDAGGILITDRTRAEINYSTIVNNGGDGLRLDFFGAPSIAKLRATILADNTNECGFFAPSDIVSMDHNLFGSLPPGCPVMTMGTDLVGVAPNLNGLSFHGGLAPVHMPFETSPVLDNAEPGSCTGVTVASVWQDQRRELRPFNFTGTMGAAICDTGSVERRFNDTNNLPPFGL